MAGHATCKALPVAVLIAPKNNLNNVTACLPFFHLQQLHGPLNCSPNSPSISPSDHLGGFDSLLCFSPSLLKSFERLTILMTPV